MIKSFSNFLNNSWVVKLLKKFVFSFDITTKDSFDGRKLSAFGVITTAIAIGFSYMYVVIERKELDWYGVALVVIYLIFGAVYLSIIDGEQLTEIITSTKEKVEEKIESKEE